MPGGGQKRPAVLFPKRQDLEGRPPAALRQPLFSKIRTEGMGNLSVRSGFRRFPWARLVFRGCPAAVLLCAQRQKMFRHSSMARRAANDRAGQSTLPEHSSAEKWSGPTPAEPKKKGLPIGSPFFLVRLTGVEPVRPFGHKHLKLASLPIPAQPHIEVPKDRSVIILSPAVFVNCFPRTERGVSGQARQSARGLRPGAPSKEAVQRRHAAAVSASPFHSTQVVSAQKELFASQLLL